MPLEPPGSTLKHRIEHPCYPVREFGGLVFAYITTRTLPGGREWDVIWEVIMPFTTFVLYTLRPSSILVSRGRSNSSSGSS